MARRKGVRAVVPAPVEAIDPAAGPDAAGPFAALHYIGETAKGQPGDHMTLLLNQPRGGWAALEELAMEWTYVLRSRQRWVASANASEGHIQRAASTLESFGLTQADIQRLARARQVEVHMAADAGDDGGWSLRIFPWEYVIAGATRPYRRGDILTVTRALEVDRVALLPAAARAALGAKPNWRVLYVESAPGPIGKTSDYRSERELIDIYLVGETDSPRLRRLYSPTSEELMKAVADHRPHVVHLCGLDSHETRLRLALAAQEERQRTGTGLSPPPSPTDEAPSERDGDGYTLAGPDGRPRIVGSVELAGALTGGRTWFPALVCFDVENSAARMAPRAVQFGCGASVGFQDAVDSGMARRFFGTLYSVLRQGAAVAHAFEVAWRSERARSASVVGSGIVLWQDRASPARSLPSGRQAAERERAVRKAADPAKVDLDWVRKRVGIKVVPEQAINYSLLHNDGELFREFALHPHPDLVARGVDVRLTLCVGIESAEYVCTLDLEGRPVDLRGEIRVSLSANLIRSVHEAIGTTWQIEIVWGRHVLLRDTWPVRLLPADQWRDAMTGRSWLPSFVFPRDRATASLVARAADYVRVLRDDPAAGFEGYQGLPPDPMPRDAAGVDMQVQAIWSTILYEWRLTYINPPPSYSSDLDSQRLRTPGAIGRDRHGTCIDLALLLAGCLELVDIWPVIFLFNDHAFPGYWRAGEFHRRFASANPERGAMREIMTADVTNNSVAGAQRYPWAVGSAMTREILREVREGRLVPIETVRLTENCGFAEAIEAGKDNFADLDRFEFLIDIAIARQNNITPLPLLGDAS